MVDTLLADRARTALENTPHLARKRFQLDAQAGRLTLSGVVTSYYQKQMAQEALRRVEGVETIENLLEVHWD